jgi:hypothetical protein
MEQHAEGIIARYVRCDNLDFVFKFKIAKQKGGNLAEKKLKPPKNQIDAMRSEFVDQVEVLKVKQTNQNKTKKN